MHLPTPDLWLHVLSLPPGAPEVTDLQDPRVSEALQLLDPGPQQFGDRLASLRLVHLLGNLLLEHEYRHLLKPMAR